MADKERLKFVFSKVYPHDEIDLDSEIKQCKFQYMLKKRISFETTQVDAKNMLF